MMGDLRKNVGDRLTAVDQLMLHIECGFDMPDLEDLNDEAQRLKNHESALEAALKVALPAMERCLSRLDDLPVKHPQQASDKAAFRAALRALAGQPPV